MRWRNSEQGDGGETSSSSAAAAEEVASSATAAAATSATSVSLATTTTTNSNHSETDGIENGSEVDDIAAALDAANSMALSIGSILRNQGSPAAPIGLGEEDPPYFHSAAQHQADPDAPSSSIPPHRLLSQSDQVVMEEENHDEGDSGQKTGSSANTTATANAATASNVEDDENDDGPSSSSSYPPWKPQVTQSTCEFTHTIRDYSQKRDSGCKKAEYSDITVDEFGNRWRLIVYVNGNGRASNHHLSLFLQVADADDLPFGWKKAVSYVLTLEHPTSATNSNLSYAKRNPDKTFKLCPKAIDWGWSQFITSDRIQQEGFVQEDSLVVRASVTVKSSSVCIDLEDAELYLKCAVEEGKPEAVQLCLDQGALVNCQFKDDLYTPLHTACSASSPEDSTNASAGATSTTGSTSANSSTSSASDSPTNNNSNSSKANGNTEGSMKVLQLLLEKGADGNASNKWKETPLLIAANNGHRAAVEALLKHGADPSLCSEAGWSALTFAAHKGYDDIVELLLRAGAPVNCLVTEDASTPLHKACAGSKPGHLQSVNLLLKNGADVHALNKWRETPLLTAANHGQAGAVDSLLKAGADPCRCTDTGWSPLSIAAYKGHDDVVELLLQEGAPTEEADPTLSALLQAATKGLPNTVELLLRHGADHTVTTKKGDTALSILVEQNLIDAAAEMVTEYNASIPRCSRDRKKVQRARLLINLRMKQQKKDGKHLALEDDDDDDDDDDIEEEDDEAELNTEIVDPAVAQHDFELAKGSNESTTNSTSNAKKKKKKKRNAEEQAKAAEEALLMELEMEDANRQKQEHEANKKSAKKRKKKERERLQKKEQEEKRLAEERERENQLRKQREAREARERATRERMAAVKRKEEEEERKRIQTEMEKKKREQQQREAEQRKKDLALKKKQEQEAKDKAAAAAAAEKKKLSSQGAKKELTPLRKASTTRSVSAPGTPASAPATTTGSSKSRGWETNIGNGNNSESKKITPAPIGSSTPHAPGPLATTSSSLSSNFLTPQRDRTMTDPFFSSGQTQSPFQQLGGELGSMLNTPQPVPPNYTKSEPTNGISARHAAEPDSLETPAVALFRRDKVSELLQRCALARSTSDSLGVVRERTLKVVLYHWMVRAAHDPSPCHDIMIPSWLDFEQLTAFFQRQLISENRKGLNPNTHGSAMTSMEALKEAGTVLAALCHSLAKEVSSFARQVESQLAHDWTDSSIGMAAQEVMRNGSASTVLLDWANRSQVYLPANTFTKLRERYVGAPSRIFSSMFVTKVRYDTKLLLVAGTPMDFRLLPDTQTALSVHASVQSEIWSDPLSASSGSTFWGQFGDIDPAFGGYKPFGGRDSNVEWLATHGGSVSVVVPLDSMAASRYVSNILDILEVGQQNQTPMSFSVLFRSECFLDGSNAPTIEDLKAMDSRLRDRSAFLVRVEPLSAGQHSFYCEGAATGETSLSGSLFVLFQNDPGRLRFNVGDAAFSEILRSMRTGIRLSVESTFVPPIPLSSSEFSSSDFSLNRNDNIPLVGARAYSFDSTPAPKSPLPHHTISADFGATGGSAMGSIAQSVPDFPSSTGASRRPPRGRLFDLVDDGEEDIALNDMDVVSGMLGNLNMDLFQQTNSNDIDVEAVSLMGIGGPPTGPPKSRLHPRPFG